MKFKLILKGYRPLCYIGINKLLLSKRNVLYFYDLTKDSYEVVGSYKISLLFRLLSFFSLTRRLLRIEFRYGMELDERRYLVVFKNSVLILDAYNKTISEQEIVERGLSFARIENVQGFEDMICFGDYKGNFIKDEITINALINNQWRKIHTFEKGEIEHVHSLIPDPGNSRVWILTGDFGNSAGIWLAEENFTKVRPIVRGEQKFRSCVAFPLDGGLLYATDSQMEENFINVLKPNNFGGFDHKVICSINGPCIYGTRLKDDFIFSTAVEPFNGLRKIDIIRGLLFRKPGRGIKSPYSQIVKLSSDLEVNILSTNEKDKYPFIFQFGTVTFPTDNYNNEDLVFYNISLKNNNNCTEIWDLNY